MISTVAYWMIARYVNVRSKWLLFVPLYRSVYIGTVANICAREMYNDSNDYSIIELCTTLCLIGTTYNHYIYRTDVTLFLLLCVILFYMVLRTIEHYVILRLISTRPLLSTLLAWVPGVMLYYVVRAYKQLGCAYN